MENNYYRPLRDNEYLTDIKGEGEPYGRLIINTRHSIQRYRERYENNSVYDNKGQSYSLSEELILTKIKLGMKKIINEYQDEGGEDVFYLIHSIKHRIGVIVNWNRFYNPQLDSGYNNAVIATFLPIKDEHYTTHPTDISMFVETEKRYYPVFERLTDLVKTEKYLLERQEVHNEKGAVDIITFKDTSFKMIFFEGNFYDCTVNEIIEVE